MRGFSKHLDGKGWTYVWDGIIGKETSWRDRTECKSKYRTKFRWDTNQNTFSEMERKMELEIESPLNICKLVCKYLKIFPWIRGQGGLLSQVWMFGYFFMICCVGSDALRPQLRQMALRGVPHGLHLTAWKAEAKSPEWLTLISLWGPSL